MMWRRLEDARVAGSGESIRVCRPPSALRSYTTTRRKPAESRFFAAAMPEGPAPRTQTRCSGARGAARGAGVARGCMLASTFAQPCGRMAAGEGLPGGSDNLGCRFSPMTSPPSPSLPSPRTAPGTAWSSPNARPLPPARPGSSGRGAAAGSSPSSRWWGARPRWSERLASTTRSARGCPRSPRWTRTRRRSSPRSTPTTQVLAGEFYNERRKVVPYDRIPKRLVQAFIASEDASFFDHPGVDVLGTLRAAFKTVLKKSTGARQRAGRLDAHPADRQGHPHLRRGLREGDQAQRHGRPQAQDPRGDPRAPAGEGADQGGDPLPLPEQRLPRAPQLRRAGRGRELLPQGRARPHARRDGAHRRPPAGARASYSPFLHPEEAKAPPRLRARADAGRRG